MKRFRNKSTSIGRRLFSLILTAVMLTVTVFASGTDISYAADTTITSMAYYSAGDGPVISASGTENASFGFVMPIFNGGAASWEDVSSDLMVYVNVNNVWTDIDEVSSFVYNSNWGHWYDSGFTGYWFVLSETTKVRLASKANPDVTLDYTLQFNQLDAVTITSMTATQGPVLTAGVTGGSGFTYPTFNGNASIVYSQVAKDLAIYIWSDDSQSWVNLDNNASSGWVYDTNWGQFTDGGGGYWFTVTETTRVRLASKANPDVYLDYTINYTVPVRNSYTLSAATETTFTANESGAIGIPLPKIDGGFPVKSELDAFVYEILINGEWVALSDTSKSGFSYKGNGYVTSSPSNQWGYWVDGIYGLWFQPIQEDMQIRIGYPVDGVAGNAINDNYVYFTFIGNPDAPRPDPVDYENINLGTADNSSIDGWNLIWNDEFNGNSLDTTKWSYQIGNGLTASGNSGWGNNELEYYTDSTENVYVSDGKLSITALKKTVTDANEGTFDVTSGRIRTVSNNSTNFSFKYGRVDFCAKLPDGAGIWPALWMLPSDTSIYGVWAASGEIDVMEARGRVTDSVCGTIHYGGTWPANKYAGEDFVFPDGQTFDSDYHVYSLVWEQDKLKWYVDGVCYYALSNDSWYSAADPSNPYAPFDQEFYILMNVAAGGWFDGGIVPDSSAYPATMQVEYVRVYQAEGDTLATYTDNSSGKDPSSGGTTPSTTQAAETTTQAAETTTQAAETTTQAAETTTQAAETTTEASVPSGNAYGILSSSSSEVTFYVNNAGFADLHYTVNDGGQINVGMNNTSGTSNYTYTVSGLSAGDTIKYFFTYQPLNEGALDTQWYTYTVPSSGTVTSTEAAEATTEAAVQTTSAVETTTESSGSGINPGSSYGMTAKGSEANFYVNNADFAIIHYMINDGEQINIGMNNTSGTSNYTYTISGLNAGDVVKYQFTYKPVDEGALDTAWFTYTVPSEEETQPSTEEETQPSTENKNNASVTFMNGSEVYSSASVEKGSTVNLPEAPAKDGSLFIGWFTDNIGTVTSVNDTILAQAFDTDTAVSQNTTLYAGWLSIPDVTIDSNDANASSNTSGFYLLGAQYRPKTDTVSAGLRFAARISSSLVKEVEALNTANANLQPSSNEDTGIGYGMVVTTANRLSGTNPLVKDVNAQYVTSGMKVCPAVKTYGSYDGYSIFTAVVTGIPESSYATNIAARMYITYVDANGIEQTYYYTETESDHNIGGAYYTNYSSVISASN